MDWLVILLRLIHIVLGAAWVGMMVMNVVFLTPTLRDAGPAAGPVMAGPRRWPSPAMSEPMPTW